MKVLLALMVLLVREAAAASAAAALRLAAAAAAPMMKLGSCCSCFYRLIQLFLPLFGVSFSSYPAVEGEFLWFFRLFLAAAAAASLSASAAGGIGIPFAASIVRGWRLAAGLLLLRSLWTWVYFCFSCLRCSLVSSAAGRIEEMTTNHLRIGSVHAAIC